MSIAAESGHKALRTPAMTVLEMVETRIVAIG